MRKTNLGYVVHALHPMAAYGYRYRSTAIAGVVHVEEYVAPIGAWIYLGHVVKF